MKTHLVSQVILKEFTNQDGLLTIHYKDSAKKPVQKTTKDVGYVEIDTAVIERLERDWNESVENDAKKTLRVLRNGDVLLYEKHTKILKKLMTLHFIRSQILMYLFNEMSQYHLDKIIDEAMPLFSGTRETLEAMVKQKLPDVLNKTLVQSLDDLIKKAGVHIDQYGLEIGVAPEGTHFVLSDSPAITMDREGNLGILQGVAILQATEFAMVMTPQHVVTLKSDQTSNTYVHLTPVQVDNLNKKQIAHSLHEYYSVSN